MSAEHPQLVVDLTGLHHAWRATIEVSWGIAVSSRPDARGSDAEQASQERQVAVDRGQVEAPVHEHGPDAFLALIDDLANRSAGPPG